MRCHSVRPAIHCHHRYGAAECSAVACACVSPSRQCSSVRSDVIISRNGFAAPRHFAVFIAQGSIALIAALPLRASDRGLRRPPANGCSGFRRRHASRPQHVQGRNICEGAAEEQVQRVGDSEASWRGGEVFNARGWRRVHESKFRPGSDAGERCGFSESGEGRGVRWWWGIPLGCGSPASAAAQSSWSF